MKYTSVAAMVALFVPSGRPAAAEPSSPVAKQPVPKCEKNEEFDRPTGPPSSRINVKSLVGKPIAEVIAKFGEPWCKTANLIRIWHPDGCSYEKDVISLWHRRGRVTRATAVHVYTGEECAFSQSKPSY